MPWRPSRPKSSDTQVPVVVGKIVGAWGVRGEVRVEPLTDFPSRFNKEAVLLLDERPIRILASRKRRGGFVLRLESIEDRDAAEALRGFDLSVPSTELESLPDGSFYYFQIIGLEVWTGESELLGTVTEIIPTGANDAYVVAAGDGGQVLVPAVEEVVREVDLAGGRMVVSLPEGLR